MHTSLNVFYSVASQGNVSCSKVHWNNHKKSFYFLQRVHVCSLNYCRTSILNIAMTLSIRQVALLSVSREHGCHIEQCNVSYSYMFEWIVSTVNSLWLNRPLKFYRKHPSSLTHQGYNRDHVQISFRGGFSKMVVYTRHLIKQMSPWLVAGMYTYRLCSVLRLLLFPKAARMWSYFHKSWAARDAPLFKSVFNQASNAVPVWNLKAPKGNFWHLSTFTMNNYCVTVSIQYSSIVCDDWIPDSWITVLQLMELDNQTTSLCCRVMTRDKMAVLGKSLHRHD